MCMARLAASRGAVAWGGGSLGGAILAGVGSSTCVVRLGMRLRI